MKTRALLLLPFIGLLQSLIAQVPRPIVFVTQVPPRAHADFLAPETITSIGNNHLPTVKSAPRGGDLMIRHVDGTLRNLTREAQLGVEGEQGTGAIAVRDPHIHWSGQKILFSMVVNSTTPSEDRWQLYEATGIDQGTTVEITRVANQPARSNNVQPCYAPDDRIIYVSDRFRDGTATYPVLDEKGQGRINTGLWSLNPVTGEVFQMEHSPSGSFDPMVDSYGRVLFTRWDHLQRDEIARDTGGFDYNSEASDATWKTSVYKESFPEALEPAGGELSLRFDLFMPWTVNPDGTDLVTLNHVGRHEFSPFAARSREDSNLMDMIFVPVAMATTSPPIRASSLMQLTEHSMHRGRIYGTDAVFHKISAGRIITILGAAPTVNAADMTVRLTSGMGVLRDPVVTSSNMIVASVAQGPNIGSISYNSGGITPDGMPQLMPAVMLPGDQPVMVDPNMTLPPDNPFLIRLSVPPATTMTPLFTFSAVLAPLPAVTITNVEEDGTRAEFTGRLWQLQPVEVRATVRPAAAVSKMDHPEREMFISAGVSPLSLKSWMRSQDLALMSVRNVTQRDGTDHQQPTNLSVPGGVSSIKDDGGPSYQVKALQMLQGEYLRGYESPTGLVREGRRIKATALRDIPGNSAPAAGMPSGSATIALDGSVAALVPARRATSWQLLGHDASPVVRERYWLSFQAGEIRSCTSCHGVNRTDQIGMAAATNPPAALASLLQSLKGQVPELRASDTFQIVSETAYGVNLSAAADDDGDDLTNLVEWGTGSNPVTTLDDPSIPALSLPKVAGAVHAQVSFPYLRADVRAGYVLEGSRDLVTWRSLLTIQRNEATPHPDYFFSTRSEVPAAGIDRATLRSRLPVTGLTDRFYRLRVVLE